MNLLVPLLVLLAPAAEGAPAPFGESVGDWVADLARDYLPPAASAATITASAHTPFAAAFLEAAVTLEPDLAEAHRWRFHLARVQGHDERARDALRRYVGLVPSDESARLQRVALAVEARQTAEARAELCRELLTHPAVPPAVASDLHRRLAEFHLNRGQRAEAVREAEAALALFAINVLAGRVRL